MKLNLSIIIGFGIIVAAGFSWLLKNLRNEVEPQYLQAIEESMVDTAHLLAAVVQQELPPTGEIRVDQFRDAIEAAKERDFEAKIYNLTKTALGVGVYVTDASGLVVYDSEGEREGKDFSRWNDVVKTLRGEYGARSTRTNEEDELSSILHVAAPVWSRGDIVGVVSVSKPQRAMRQFINETRSRMVWIGGLACGGIVLAATLFSYWMMRPVRQMTEYARSVKAGERVAPPRLRGSEFRTLATAFEEMRDALEDRQFVETYVQNLTHEIKSPLAAIRGAAELLQEGDVPREKQRRFLSNIHDEVLRSQNIVDRLLHLSALESQKSLQVTTEVDIGELVQRVCDGAFPMLEKKGLTLLTEFPESVSPLRVHGDVFSLRMAVNNLITNAIDFSPEGGEICVRLADTGMHAMIQVLDQGPGVPDYAREKVFERFYSLKGQVTGKKSSGLGLCFVREAAELHGGSAVLENRSDQQGAKVTMTMRKER